MSARKSGPLTARVYLAVDDEVVFDDTLDAWVFTPPDYFKDAIRSDAKPEPWLKAIMIVMADAAVMGKSVCIEATTGSTWSLRVQEGEQ